jgi:peptidoglycan/LPS O-acetylase OafA/YrhL
MKRIAELDGLRAVAVGLVIADHAQTIAPVPAWIGLFGDGGLGVTIFFVLSGYLITRLLTEEKQRTGTIHLGAFYLRRAIRILPASYTYLAVVAVVASLGLADVAWQQVVIAFFHLWNYDLLLLPHDMPVQGAVIIGHFWSLALEEQFYWMWPLGLVTLAPRWLHALLFAIVAGAALARLGTYVLFPGLRGAVNMMFHTALDPIAIGALLAIFEASLADRVRRISRHWVTLGVVTLFLMLPTIHFVCGSYWSITYGRTIDAAIAGFVILAMTHRGEHAFALLMRARPIQFIGTISFSLYIWQQAFCIHGAMFEMPPILAVPLSVLTATISYYAIERPLIRWRARRVPGPEALA